MLTCSLYGIKLRIIRIYIKRNYYFFRILFLMENRQSEGKIKEKLGDLQCSRMTKKPIQFQRRRTLI